MLGLEAAHCRHRIVHAKGDGTGKEIMRALAAAVRGTPSITVLEGVEARRLTVADGAVNGVLAASASGALLLPTNRVVLATGGVGGLFLQQRTRADRLDRASPLRRGPGQHSSTWSSCSSTPPH